MDDWMGDRYLYDLMDLRWCNTGCYNMECCNMERCNMGSC